MSNGKHMHSSVSAYVRLWFPGTVI